MDWLSSLAKGCDPRIAPELIFQKRVVLAQDVGYQTNSLGKDSEVAPIFRARSGLRMIKLIVLELNWRFVANA